MDGVGCLQFDFHTDRDRLADDQRARRGQLLVLEQDVRRARRRRRRQAREPAPARPEGRVLGGRPRPPRVVAARS